MSYESSGQKPVRTIKDEIMPSVSCSIWEREGEHGKWYSLNAPQISKNVGRKSGTEEWKYFASFSANEVPAAIRVMNRGLEEIGKLMSKQRELKRENGNSVELKQGFEVEEYEDFEEVV